MKWQRPDKKSSLHEVAEDLRALQRALLERSKEDAEMAKKLVVQRMKNRG
jgi:hypothetical protein